MPLILIPTRYASATQNTISLSTSRSDRLLSLNPGVSMRWTVWFHISVLCIVGPNVPVENQRGIQRVLSVNKLTRFETMTNNLSRLAGAGVDKCTFPNP